MKIQVLNASNKYDLAIIVDGFCNHKGQTYISLEHFDNDNEHQIGHLLREWFNTIEVCKKCGASRWIDMAQGMQGKWQNERLFDETH